MNEIDIVESTMSTDVGDTTANRFRYQWVCSAISCCALLDDKADIEEVFCEHHEDILLKRRDGKYIGVQVKTRDSTQPLWSASDEIVLKSFARFTVLNLQFPGQFCEFTFSTNHPMQSRRNGQDVCYLLDSIDMTQHPARFRTSFRNRGKLDRNMKIVIHPGVWTGINA